MEKLFVITRKDLSTITQAVQSGHSVAQWMLDNPKHAWRNTTLEYLSADSEDHLEMLCRKLNSLGLKYSEFIEPDLNNQRTSIAIYGHSYLLRKYKRMGA